MKASASRKQAQPDSSALALVLALSVRIDTVSPSACFLGCASESNTMGNHMKRVCAAIAAAFAGRGGAPSGRPYRLGALLLAVLATSCVTPQYARCEQLHETCVRECRALPQPGAAYLPTGGTTPQACEADCKEQRSQCATRVWPRPASK